MTEKKHNRRLQGTVVSDTMAKTVVVRVDRMFSHPKYHIRSKASKNYKAHDEQAAYHVGDQVIIEECRPLSRDKRWRVVSKITK